MIMLPFVRLCYRLQQIGDSPADSEEVVAPLEESCVPSSEDDLEAESDPGQLPVWKRDFSPTAVSNLILK